MHTTQTSIRSLMLPVLHGAFASLLLVETIGAAETGVAIATTAELKSQVSTAEGRRALAQGEFKRIFTPSILALGEADQKVIVQTVSASPEIISDVMFGGPPPEDGTPFLKNLLTLSRHDPAGMRDPHERSTAVAVAQLYSGGAWPKEPDMVIKRYVDFRDARKNGLLHPSFDTLLAWEKLFVVSLAQNGGYSDGWSEKSAAFLRDSMKLPMAQYPLACWQANYCTTSPFGYHIADWAFYQPFAYDFPSMSFAQNVRDYAGGVCGSLSHLGANAAKANGIPATTCGEPAHCAYAVRVSRDRWVAGNVVDAFGRTAHTSWWGGTWSHLLQQNDAMIQDEAWQRSMSHVWQARALIASQPALAIDTYRLALAASPLNYPTWRELVKFLAVNKSYTPADWQALDEQLLAAFVKYPETACELSQSLQQHVFPQLDAAAKRAWILRMHRAICGQAGPNPWDFEALIAAQMTTLAGDDTTARLAFFGELMEIHSIGKPFANRLLSWGQRAFGNDPKLAQGFRETISRSILSASKSADSKDALRSALSQAILAASAADDVTSFQSLGQVCKEFIPPNPFTAEPFPGTQLSQGGLLKTSSTCSWDSPFQYWGVLEPICGGFHTADQVRPYAIVKLAKLGDLSGIIIRDVRTGDHLHRQLPIQVSVSEDGVKWTPVFRATTPENIRRIPLDGKATRVRYVKVERDDDKINAPFHLNAIHVYGRPLQ